MEIIFNEKNFTEKEADWMDAYIKKIINNCIADFLKSIKSRSENSPDFMTEDLPDIDNHDIEKIEAKKYRIFEFTISISDIELSEILDHLSSHMVSALLLGIGLGMSSKELSKRLEVSERMVQYYKSKGKKIIKNKLNKKE